MAIAIGVENESRVGLTIPIIEYERSRNGIEQPDLLFKALVLDSYRPYLPFGYKDPNSHEANSGYNAGWKEDSDQTASPRIIATIYKNLHEGGFIPSYNKNFVMVSVGSSLPTHERIFFDIDQRKRRGKTHVVSVDMQEIPESLLSTLTVGGKPNLEGLLFNPHENTHQFIKSEEKLYSVGKEQIDMIGDFRSSLYYSLSTRFLYHTIDESIKNARETLMKYYNELRNTGCIVVDAEEYNCKSADTKMYSSTGECILERWEDLGIDSMFDPYIIGESKARVMVLKKKSENLNVENFTSRGSIVFKVA